MCASVYLTFFLFIHSFIRSLIYSLETVSHETQLSPNLSVVKESLAILTVCLHLPSAGYRNVLMHQCPGMLQVVGVTSEAAGCGG